MSIFTDHTDDRFADLAALIPTRCRRKRLADLAEYLGTAIQVDHFQIEALEKMDAINKRTIKALNDIVAMQRATINELRNRVSRKVPAIANGNGHDNVPTTENGWPNNDPAYDA